MMKQLPSLILSSNSPRRQELLRQIGAPFEVRVKPVDESFPHELPPEEVAVYLAEKKAAGFTAEELGEKILLTADTIVCLGERILNKPADSAEAAHMLQQLSGRSHRVITGVCLRSAQTKRSFCDETHVHFRPLTAYEIEYYITAYKPFDKAGAYGIQEWIGMIAVEKLEGSYYNVMGLPLHRVYAELLEFV